MKYFLKIRRFRLLRRSVWEPTAQCLALALVVGCAPSSENLRTARPSEEGEEITGYLESIETDIEISDDQNIQIHRTVVRVPKNAATSNFSVRLRRMPGTPALTEEEDAVLGAPVGDVIEAEFYFKEGAVPLTQADLQLAWRFQQVISVAADEQNIGLVIISDPGTSSEMRAMVPGSELSFEPDGNLGFSLATAAKVSGQLRLTRAVFWLVSYRDEALDLLTIRTLNQINSVDGAEAAVSHGATSSSTTATTTTLPPSENAPETEQVTTPVFSPAGGSFASSTQVSISTATSGASIRYTDDGSNPTATAGNIYNGPINLSATKLIKAIAFKAGMLDSSVASAGFSINTGGAWVDSSPATYSQNAGLSTNWSSASTTDLLSLDNIFVSAELSEQGGGTSTTSELLVTGFSGLSALSDSVSIQGIKLEIARNVSDLDCEIKDLTVKLYNGTTAIGTNLADTQAWTTNLGYKVYGGPTEMWGTSLTVAQVKQAEFGVAIRAEIPFGGVGCVAGNSETTARIDHVRMIVYYYE